MILINLLPEELRPIKRTPLPYIITGGGLLLSIAGMALVFITNMATHSGLNAELATNNQELTRLQPVIDEFNALSNKKLELQDKIETIQEILSDRKIWSEHLHKLATLTPDNVWYSRIRVYSKPERRQQQRINPETKKPELDAKTGQPKMETVNVSVPVLEVSGYVVNDDTGTANVAPLSDATSRDPEFAQHFKFDNVSKLEDTLYKEFTVRSFTLQYKIQVAEKPTVEAAP